MSDEREIVDEYERKRVSLAAVENESAQEESRLVEERSAIVVEQSATIAQFEARRKQLLADLKEERERVLADLKMKRKRLSYQIRGARVKQLNARKKMMELRKERDAKLEELQPDSQECDLDEFVDDELEDWNRRMSEFKAFEADIDVHKKRREAIIKAFRALPPSNRVPETQVEEGTALKSLQELLDAIRLDKAETVYQCGAQLLQTSSIEELSAKQDATHQGMFKLPGVQALYTALCTPMCSWRTLSLLTEWGAASVSSAEYYYLFQLQDAWIAGFKDLEWPPASARMPKFLPHTYTPSARIEEVLVRGFPHYRLVQDSTEVVDLTQSPGELAREPFEAESEEVQRFVNHATKLVNLQPNSDANYFYYSIFCNRPTGMLLEERRGRMYKVTVDMSDREIALIRRVVSTFWRL